MQKRKPRIPPTNDNKLLVFAKNLITIVGNLISGSPPEWKHVTEQDIKLVSVPLAAFQSAIDTWRAVPTKNNRVEKDKKKEVLRKGISAFLNSFVRKNIHVTAQQLVQLMMSEQDSNQSTIGVPLFACTGDISFPAVGRVAIENIHPMGTPTAAEALALHGAAYFYGVVGSKRGRGKYHLETIPLSGDDFSWHEFTTKSKFVLDLTGESGNKLYICLRYENAKGQPGPWGPIIVVNIP